MIDTAGLPPELAAALGAVDPAQGDEDLLGPIAEGTMARGERLARGQYFTPTPLVDLVLSFCLRDAGARVLDPACGTGAFLVRSFARKRHLGPARSAATIVDELYGVDAAAVPAELARINLASRGETGAPAPHVIRRDFLSIPPPDSGRRPSLPRVDAVVGNPPWVQQESLPIRGSRSGPSKDDLRRRVLERTGCRLSGRSDLHAYFWPQAALFLAPGGRLGFVTSAQWLDAGYGDGLREWIPRWFAVEAILESTAEPWFPGARVDSLVTILRRRDPDGGAGDGPARLVQLLAPLSELAPHDGTTATALAAADGLRDAILAPATEPLVDGFQVRLLSQAKLRSGPRASRERRRIPSWGRPLRTPDLWGDVFDRTRSRWVPVGDCCDIRRGLTSGCDGFFYPRDVTRGALEIHPGGTEFRDATGYPRSPFEDGELQLVSCAVDGTRHAVEARFLEPLVHGPLDLDSFRVPTADVRRWVLWIPAGVTPGPHLARYLRHGERLGIPGRPTCVARTSGNRPWYDLTRPRSRGLLWPKERQFRHLVPMNLTRWAANCRLYEIRPRTPARLPLWAGIFNSTWTLLSSVVHGRPVGAEAVWSTMVGEVRRMPIPDPRSGPESALTRVQDAFSRMQRRAPASFLPGPGSELEHTDRRLLDDAVLDLLGVDDRVRREGLLDELYAHLGRRFTRLREKEARAAANKRRRPQGS